MLPVHQEYGQWPTSGEIDIMESRGNQQYTNPQGTQVGAEQFGATLHYGIDYNMNGWPKAHFDSNTPAGQPWSNDFHVYEMEWTPDAFTFRVDGQEVGNVVIPEGGFWELGEFSTEWPGTANPWEGQAKNAPFDKDFYLILNVAVGGINYFADENINLPYPKPWSNQSPQAAFDFYSAKDMWYPTWQGEAAAMQVDYVRVFAL